MKKAKEADGFAKYGSEFANTGDLANWKKVALATRKKTGVRAVKHMSKAG